MFWQASKSGTQEEFVEVLKELTVIDKYTYKYLLENKPEIWARAFFSTISFYDTVEKNMCETFNGYILEAREKPIIQMLEEIMIALMIRMQSKRETM